MVEEQLYYNRYKFTGVGVMALLAVLGHHCDAEAVEPGAGSGKVLEHLNAHVSRTYPRSPVTGIPSGCPYTRFISIVPR